MPLRPSYKNRIHRMSKTTLLVCLISIFFTGNVFGEDKLVKRTQVLMGTFVSITLPSQNLYASNLAFKRLKEVEHSLSSYDKNALIYRLNHEGKIELSEDAYEALSLSKHYYKQTNGYFDITIGSITKGLFHFGENETVAKKEDLQKAKVDFKGLHFNELEAWIDKDIVLDLGGMGKGFGVDKAVEILIGVSRAVVALSGDIYCIGECEMSIQNPFNEGSIAEFKMKDMAISTSGNYRRFVKSKEYNHLINPKHKRSQKTFASITLISNVLSNSDLDAYATAASVMPYSKALTFLRERELGFLVVSNEKELVVSDNFNVLTSELTLFQPLKIQEKEYIRAVPLTFQKTKRL